MADSDGGGSSGADVPEINILPPFPTGIAADRPASPLPSPVTELRRYSHCVRWLRKAWTSDPYTGFDKSKVVLGPPTPPSGVPGPLPLLGVGAAFGFSRRLRRRVARRPFLQPQA